MNIQLVGKNQGNLEGECFESESWWWYPLWEYVCMQADGILSEEQIESGCYKKDAEITESQCLAIADLLERAVKSGNTKRYEQERKKYFESFDNLPCDRCNGLEDEWKDPVCYRCGGSGKLDSCICPSSFYETNVKQFKVFLENCGGFSIW